MAQTKTLIAVVSAQHRKNWRDAIRSTWLAMVPEGKADVRFFIGADTSDEPNVVPLNCGDLYKDLPEKVRQIMKWALDHGYDYMLKCDDDVVLRPVELLLSGYEKHQYSGKINRYLNQGYNVPVGFNWWVSRQCMEIMVGSPLPDNNDDEKWVAETLHQHGIHIVNDHRYEIYIGDCIDLREDYPFHRPLRPPKPKDVSTKDTFSWTVFLEADSGNSIPVEKKIAEFHRLFNKLNGKT
jgi:hypothetical protein